MTTSIKRYSLVVLLTLGTLANAWGQEGKKNPAIMAWADSLTGQERWLKIVVLKLEDSGNSKDPTNIDMKGHVYYRAAIAGQVTSVTQTTTVEDFEEAARVKYDMEVKKGTHAGHTWKYARGTKVRIEEIDLSNEDIKIEIKEGEKGKKTALRLKFEKKEYTRDEVQRLYAAAFADSEGGVVETVNIELGMTPEQVIAAKGQPISRTSLGPKVILTYKDMKMIFQDGKLVDVQ